MWVFIIISCEEIVNEQDISLDAVEVLAPVEGSILKSNKGINYSWQAVEGAINYRMQIAMPSFTRATQIELDTLVSTTSYSVDSLKSGDYQWRVKALNSAYETAYTTTNFTVGGE